MGRHPAAVRPGLADYRPALTSMLDQRQQRSIMEPPHRGALWNDFSEGLHGSALRQGET